MTDLARGGTTVAGSPPSATALGIAVGATWTERLDEIDTTIGLGFKQGGLLGGKLEIVGDMSYTLAIYVTGYGPQPRLYEQYDRT